MTLAPGADARTIQTKTSSTQPNRTDSTTTGSVLVIDDDRATLDTYSTILELAGFEVRTAATAHAGIEVALGRPFDAILVDVNLPDSSGLEVVRELRRLAIEARLVIVTAFPSLDAAFDAAGAGADGFVEGPLWGEEIVELVVQAVRGSAPIRSPGRDRGYNLSPTSETRPKAQPLLDSRIREVMRLINSDLTRAWPTAELAERVGLSESGLSHLFQTCVGVSLPTFKRERRLLGAADRLLTTHESIRRVAYAVGFRSESLRDFRRAFRNRFHMSPAEYRVRCWGS